MIYHVFLFIHSSDYSDWMKEIDPGCRGQPALLYLVPCTLGLTLLLSLCRDAWMDRDRCLFENVGITLDGYD